MGCVRRGDRREAPAQGDRGLAAAQGGRILPAGVVAPAQGGIAHNGSRTIGGRTAPVQGDR